MNTEIPGSNKHDTQNYIDLLESPASMLKSYSHVSDVAPIPIPKSSSNRHSQRFFAQDALIEDSEVIESNEIRSTAEFGNTS